MTKGKGLRIPHSEFRIPDSIPSRNSTTTWRTVNKLTFTAFSPFFVCSGELRNGALQIWRGVVCLSGDFTFRINILNSISTPHKHSFLSITNVLPVSRDLSHPFLTFFFNPNLHHFINNTCNLIHFLSMTIDTKFMQLIGVFLNYLRFVNYNVSC